MFNFSDVTTSKEVLPEGHYQVEVVQASLKDTKSGGKRIEVDFVIVGDSPQAKRHIYHSFNMSGMSEKAVEIGRRQMKEFLIVSGYSDPNNLSEPQALIGLAVTAVVKHKEDDMYGTQARVSYFKKAFNETKKDTPTF